MKEWTPAGLSDINKIIEYQPFLLNQEELAFWNFIKVPPDKWHEHSMGNEGGGFWVVGIAGNKAIYYNDIEDGFNLSTFVQFGTLDEYNCSQIELHELIISLYECIRKGHIV